MSAFDEFLRVKLTEDPELKAMYEAAERRRQLVRDQEGAARGFAVCVLAVIAGVVVYALSFVVGR